MELGKHKKRFWSKVVVLGEDQCWEWVAAVGVQGYGHFGVGRKVFRAHRIAYFMLHDGLSDSICVLHRCDNRKCVNPKHLFLGTYKDNYADMVAKGRRVKSSLRGAQINTNKLTESQVLEIRKDTRTQTMIAKEYGIRQGTVSSIKLRKIWKHLSD